METSLIESTQESTFLSSFMEPTFDEATSPEQEAFDALCADVIKVGRKIAKKEKEDELFSTYFADNAELIITLRQQFPPKGSHATRLVKIDGELVPLTWREFVETRMGVTLQYLNRLLKKYETKDAPEDDDMDTVDVDVNETPSKDELLAMVKSMDEDEATAVLGQIEDNFETDEENTEVSGFDLATLKPHVNSPAIFATQATRLINAYIKSLGVKDVKFYVEIENN